MECKLAHVRLDPFRSSDKNYLTRAEDEFRTIIENCENNLFGNVNIKHQISIQYLIYMLSF